MKIAQIPESCKYGNWSFCEIYVEELIFLIKQGQKLSRRNLNDLLFGNIKVSSHYSKKG